MANNHIADDRKKVRLIDANYFVNKGIRNCPIEEGGIPLGDFAKHQKILELYPTVDAVEVVRCKDCKHNEDCIRRIQFWGRNPVLELNTTEYHPLDFCSYGERRTDETKAG